MSSFFDSIEAVFVINLDRRPERWAAFQQRWKGIIPEKKMIRVSAVDGRHVEGFDEYPWFDEDINEQAKMWWAGVAGRALSHKKAIYEAMKGGFFTIVVMEDDCMPSVTMSKFKYDHVFNKFLNKEHRWGMLYLGFGKLPFIGAPFIRSGKNQIDIWRVAHVSNAHAYAIHRDAFTSILSNLPEREWVWNWIAKYRSVNWWFRYYFESKSHLPVYVALPRLVTQGGFTSDIDPAQKMPHVKVIDYRKPFALNWLFYSFFKMFKRPLSFMRSRFSSMFFYRRIRKKRFRKMP